VNVIIFAQSIPVDLPEKCPVTLHVFRTIDAPDGRAPIVEAIIERMDLENPGIHVTR
jgi:hypothetical protein